MSNRRPLPMHSPFYAASTHETCFNTIEIRWDVLESNQPSHPVSEGRITRCQHPLSQVYCASPHDLTHVWAFAQKSVWVLLIYVARREPHEFPLPRLVNHRVSYSPTNLLNESFSKAIYHILGANWSITPNDGLSFNMKCGVFIPRLLQTNRRLLVGFLPNPCFLHHRAIRLASDSNCRSGWVRGSYLS